MTVIKNIFSNGWNPIFLMLAILTASIELYSLWYILGWEPYIIIAVIVCTVKSFALLNNKGFLGTLLVGILICITIFFSVQRPLSIILNSKSSEAKVDYYEKLISRTQSEYDALILDYKAKQNSYTIARRDRAYGIIRDFDSNNTLGIISDKVELKKLELNKYERELLSFNDNNNNWYRSLLILLIIVTVEILLVISSRKVSFRRIEHNIINEDVDEIKLDIQQLIIKPKRKYTKKPKSNNNNTFLDSDI